MYENYYNLQSNPFGNTADPDGHYVNASTREAMASIIHGIESRKGFITLVGEPGTGKTTLLRRIVEETGPETTFAMLFNSGVTFDELLAFICMELGIVLDDSRRLNRLARLNDYLLDALVAGRNVVVIIDDAQTLDDKVLEDLRLLTNLETAKEKILQIVLCGQPELENKLAQHHMRQVRQRVGVRARLEPLSAEDIEEYVETRLQSAGALQQDLFSPRDLKRIWKAASGIPRTVNHICEQALSDGFSRNERPVSAATVKHAINAVCGDVATKREWKVSLPSIALPSVDFGRMAQAAGAIAVASLLPILGPSIHERIFPSDEYAPVAEVVQSAQPEKPIIETPRAFNAGPSVEGPGKVERAESPGGRRVFAAAKDDGGEGYWKPDRKMPTELVMGMYGECGNGLVERGEKCDDGNDSNNDRCLGNCEHNVCGDGAVLTGIDTVLADDPRLNARVPAGGTAKEPLRVILDSRLRLPPTARTLEIPECPIPGGVPLAKRLSAGVRMPSYEMMIAAA